eukprot:2703230-Lingulodinium_polyedra.AAC.1
MLRAGRALGGIASRLKAVGLPGNRPVPEGIRRNVSLLSDAPAGYLRRAGGLEELPDRCLPAYTRPLKASRAALGDAKRAAADLAKVRSDSCARAMAGPQGD